MGEQVPVYKGKCFKISLRGMRACMCMCMGMLVLQDEHCKYEQNLSECLVCLKNMAG
jgi:hypothetical protein